VLHSEWAGCDSPSRCCATVHVQRL
jgi:hypothetical protein